MSADQQIKLEPLTSARWMEIVAQSGLLAEDPPLRRQSPRYHVDGLIKAIIHPPLGAPKDKAPEEMSCSVLEISEGGVMLRARRELRTYTRLTIEWPDGELFFALSGSVKHCTGTVGAFKVGVELDFPPGNG
jgi:hypothetical protein